MSTKTIRSAFIAIATFSMLAGTPGFALPIVSVDVTGGTPTIDGFLQIDPGDPLTVDIVVEGLDDSAGEFLNGFEFDLVFDSAVLSVAGVTPGATLLPPAIVIQDLVGTMSVEFAELSLLPAGVTTGGVLASISFDTLAEGSSALDLENVILSAPFGVPIAATVVDGAVQVGDALAPIPEPGAAALFGVGLLVASRATRTRRFDAAQLERDRQANPRTT